MSSILLHFYGKKVKNNGRDYLFLMNFSPYFLFDLLITDVKKSSFMLRTQSLLQYLNALQRTTEVKSAASISVFTLYSTARHFSTD